MTTEQAIHFPTPPLRRARAWFRARRRFTTRYVPGPLWMVAVVGIIATVLFFVRGR